MSHDSLIVASTFVLPLLAATPVSFRIASGALTRAAVRLRHLTPEAADAAAASVFADASWLRANGHESVILAEAGHERRLFTVANGQARLCDRAVRVNAPLVHAMAQAIMADGLAHHVVFDSVDWHGPRHGTALIVHHHSNWIATPATALPAPLRKKARRVAQEHGGALTLDLLPVGAESAALFERVVGWTEARVHEHGRRFRLTSSEREAVWAASHERGSLAVLRVGDTVIAGSLIGRHDRDMVVHVLGHNPAFDRYSPGVLLLAHLRVALAQEGGERLHLLWGDRRHKSDCGARPQRLVTVIVPRRLVDLLRPSVMRQVASLTCAAAKTQLRYWIKGLPGAKA